MHILLNEIPGEKCLALESGNFDMEQIHAAVKEHGITAVLLNGPGAGGAFLKKIKEKNLKIGLLIDSLAISELKKLIAKNYLDFVALEVRGTAGLKETVGLLRASSTGYELRLNAEKLSPEVLKEAYELCMPCDTFAVYNAPSVEFFMDFARDKKNVVLRH